MEDNFRNVLIILSAIVIAAIFIHGFWTIRKNKNPYKLKAKAKGSKVDLAERGFDGSGFDQDGVSRARVVGGSTLNQNEIPQEAAPTPNYDEVPLPQDLEKRSTEKSSLEPTLGDLSDITEQAPQNVAPLPAQVSDEPHKVEPEAAVISTEDELTQAAPVVENEPKPEVVSVYQTPISQPKNSQLKNSQPNKIVNTKTAKPTKITKAEKEALKRNQMEINFGNDLAIDDEPMPTISINEPVVKKAAIEIEPEVIVVSVVMNADNSMSGAALLPTLLTLGLRFGDMDIFHRHQDNAGNGKVTFSLANMMNPGTFNLDEIESFSTQGISLFMTLPNAGDPFEVFEQMMSAAKQLSSEFGGQLLDDKRSVMTKQTEQHYISKIREFERKSRIANA